MPKVAEKPPPNLHPYIFHGVDLTWSRGDKEALGDCPWCGREGKFSVNLQTGKWQCWICRKGTDRGGGNLSVFLQMLWQASDKATNDYQELVAKRGLMYPDTLIHWEVARSVLTGNWLVPGYNVDGKRAQLYSYYNNRLFPTPTLGHRLHGVNLYDADKPIVYLCEGPWDGMMLWEALGQLKPTDDGLSTTANTAVSLLAEASVLAVPGCNVFPEAWLPLFAGKTVNLLLDSDYPRTHPRTGGVSAPVGLTATKRTADLLSEAEEPPAAINYLHWGKDGYDPRKPSGFDVSDLLTQIA